MEILPRKVGDRPAKRPSALRLGPRSRRYRALPMGRLQGFLRLAGAGRLRGRGGSRHPLPAALRRGREPDRREGQGRRPQATSSDSRFSPPRTPPGSPAKDPVQDAAAVASAVYPAVDGRQPQAVTLVDQEDWAGGIAAAALMAPPLRAPILLTDGENLPDATSDALELLRPTGAALARRAQAFKVGDAATPGDLRTVPIQAKDDFRLAAAIDEFRTRTTGEPSPNVIVAPADDPRFAMPAAAWAAKSGDAVLFSAKRRAAACDASGDRAARTPRHLRSRPEGADLRCRRQATEATGVRHAHQRQKPCHERACVRTLLRRRIRLGNSGSRTRARDRELAPPARRRCRGAAFRERQIRAAALDRYREHPSALPPGLPARHPAGIPVRPCSRRLQSRLAASATSLRSASLSRPRSTS